MAFLSTLLLLSVGPSWVFAALPASITVAFDPNFRFATDDLPLTSGALLRTQQGFQPEGVHISLAGPGNLNVQWSTGAPKLGASVDPYDPASVASLVKFGTASGKYDTQATGTARIFNQIYAAAPYASNYSSPIIHTAKLSGLQPGTKYFYTVGDGNVSSKEYSFVYPKATGSYPQLFTFFGDMGTTYNSSSTLDHMLQSTSDGAVVCFTGDFVYADTYLSNGTFKLNTAASAGKGTPQVSNITYPDQTFQPRWDGWARFMEPLISRAPFMPTFGNHEIEKQATKEFYVGAPARYATPFKESGSSNPTWYSFEVSGAHIVTLNNYLDYNMSSPQYQWLVKDLAAVDRSVTPFIFVQTHTPWYNTYVTHYKEGECFRQAGYEKLFFDNGVNAVLHGHVHAYERVYPVYNYTLNACAPSYITIGDAGNAEGTYAYFVDQAGNCPKVPVNGTAAYQPDQFGVGVGLVGVPKACPSLLDGGANNGYCPASQPAWSAYREPSFGHGTLNLLNATTAQWKWMRNQDGFAVAVDSTYVVVDPVACPNMANKKAKTA